MKTSEYENLQDAVDAAIAASASEDRIVTLWCDDTSVDDAVDCLAAVDADHESIDVGTAVPYVDCWGDDWRIYIRQTR